MEIHHQKEDTGKPRDEYRVYSGKKKAEKSITPVSPAVTGVLTFDYGINPKIYFRNSSQLRLSENFTLRKFPAIRYITPEVAGMSVRAQPIML